MADYHKIRHDIVSSIRPLWTTIYADEWIWDGNDIHLRFLMGNKIQVVFNTRKEPWLDPNKLNDFIKALKKIPSVKYITLHKKNWKPNSISWIGYPTVEIKDIIFELK